MITLKMPLSSSSRPSGQRLEPNRDSNLTCLSPSLLPSTELPPGVASMFSVSTRNRLTHRERAGGTSAQESCVKIWRGWPSGPGERGKCGTGTEEG